MSNTVVMPFDIIGSCNPVGLDFLSILPTTICKLPIVRSLRNGIAVAQGDVVSMFISSVELEGINSVAEATVVKGEAFMTIVEQLIIPSKMKASISEAVQQYRQCPEGGG